MHIILNKQKYAIDEVIFYTKEKLVIQVYTWYYLLNQKLITSALHCVCVCIYMTKNILQSNTLRHVGTYKHV